MALIEHKESVTVNGQFFRNDSTVAYSQVTESGTIPASLVMESSEKIAPDSVITATINGVAAEVVPWGYTVNAGEVAVERELGLWKFNAANVGTTASVTYDPAGTVLTAAKMAVVGTAPVTSVNSKTGAVELAATDIPYLGGSVSDAIVDLYGVKQPLAANLTALSGIATTGLLTRTGAGTAAARTLTAGTGISVTNGSGATGNPTVAVNPAAAIAYSAAQTFNAGAIIKGLTLGVVQLYANSGNVNHTVQASDVILSMSISGAWTVNVTMPSPSVGRTLLIINTGPLASAPVFTAVGGANFTWAGGGFVTTYNGPTADHAATLLICESATRWRVYQLC